MFIHMAQIYGSNHLLTWIYEHCKPKVEFQGCSWTAASHFYAEFEVKKPLASWSAISILIMCVCNHLQKV